MAERKSCTSAGLRHRVRHFLSATSEVRRPLVETLRAIQCRGWDAYVFGGVARDLMVGPAGTRPRDVDLVCVAAGDDDIQRTLGNKIVRRTRFGGFHFAANHWLFDLWPVSSTWAFRAFPNRFKSIQDLPRTTFFNVEAVVFSLAADSTGARVVYENGFFDALNSKCLEINFPENPYPELCVLRAFYLSRKLRFSIGPRLAEYIADARHSVTTKALMEVQLEHYGRSRISADDLELMWDYVVESVAASPGASVWLPQNSSGMQLYFWDLDTQ